jgi:hypothetical protein
LLPLGGHDQAYALAGRATDAARSVTGEVNGQPALLRGVQNEHEGGVVDEHEQGVVGAHGDGDMLTLPAIAVDADDRPRTQRSPEMPC